ncbi:MAG: hypothetical protein WBB05_25125 [Mycolicibacterium fortuitum]
MLMRTDPFRDFVAIPVTHRRQTTNANTTVVPLRAGPVRRHRYPPESDRG